MIVIFFTSIIFLEHCHKPLVVNAKTQQWQPSQTAWGDESVRACGCRCNRFSRRFDSVFGDYKGPFDTEAEENDQQSEQTVGVGADAVVRRRSTKTWAKKTVKVSGPASSAKKNASNSIVAPNESKSGGSPLHAISETADSSPQKEDTANEKPSGCEKCRASVSTFFEVSIVKTIAFILSKLSILLRVDLNPDVVIGH